MTHSPVPDGQPVPLGDPLGLRVKCRTCLSLVAAYVRAETPFYHRGRRLTAQIVLCVPCVRRAIAGASLDLVFKEDDGTGPPEFYSEPQTVDGYELIGQPGPKEIVH